MKIILSLGVAGMAIAMLAIKPLSKYRWKIMGAYAVLVICLFAFYNYRTVDLILPFYHPVNQMFYQDEFAQGDEGIYPDSFLPYYLKGRTVMIPEYMKWDDIDLESEDIWESGQMLCINLINVLKSCDAKIETGDNRKLIQSDAIRDDFTDMGYLNDTFRYSFLHNDITTEYGNAFYYLWFYSANSTPFKLFICDDGSDRSDSLVLLFDENMNIYLVSSEYYESKKEVL